MRRLILAGGGDPKDSKLLDIFYNKLLRKKRLLFLPQAVAPKMWSYDRAYFWLRKNKALRNVKIQMWKTLVKRSFNDLAGFGTVYIMGGNTFELAYKLRKTGFIQHLARFIDSGRVVYGISAGAVILGRNIKIAQVGPEADENRIGLRNLTGLNLLKGYNIHPHYKAEHDHELFDHLRKTRIPFIAIPEKSGIYMEGERMHPIGFEPVYLFRRGVKQSLATGSHFQLPKN